MRRKLLLLIHGFLAVCSIGVGLYIIPRTTLTLRALGMQIPDNKLTLLSLLGLAAIICGVVMIVRSIKLKPYIGERFTLDHYKHFSKEINTTALSIPGLCILAYTFKFTGPFFSGAAKAYLDKGFYVMGISTIVLLLGYAIASTLIFLKMKKL